ncbi:unnamed protein product, partial [Coregonus sp. 'balchen']
MFSSVSLRAQIASIIEVLSKTAVAEISKVVDDGIVVLRVEMCQRENEINVLKKTVQQLDSELRRARGIQARKRIHHGRSVAAGNLGRGPGKSGTTCVGRTSLEKLQPEEYGNEKDEGVRPADETPVKTEPGEEEGDQEEHTAGRKDKDHLDAELSTYERVSQLWMSSTQEDNDMETSNSEDFNNSSGRNPRCLPDHSPGTSGMAEASCSSVSFPGKPYLESDVRQDMILQLRQQQHYRQSDALRRTSDGTVKSNPDPQSVFVSMDGLANTEEKPSLDRRQSEEERCNEKDEVIQTAPEMPMKSEPGEEKDASQILDHKAEEQTAGRAEHQLDEELSMYERDSQPWMSGSQADNDIETSNSEYFSSSGMAAASCSSASFPGKPYVDVREDMILRVGQQHYGPSDTLLIASDGTVQPNSQGMDGASLNHQPIFSDGADMLTGQPPLDDEKPDVYPRPSENPEEPTDQPPPAEAQPVCGHSEEEGRGQGLVGKAEQEKQFGSQILSQSGHQHQHTTERPGYQDDPEYVMDGRETQLCRSFTERHSDTESGSVHPGCSSDVTKQQNSHPVSPSVKYHHSPFDGLHHHHHQGFYTSASREVELEDLSFQDEEDKLDMIEEEQYAGMALHARNREDADERILPRFQDRAPPPPLPVEEETAMREYITEPNYSQEGILFALGIDSFDSTEGS